MGQSPVAGVLVAGIGASAGSAGALHALFGATAPGGGLAYVVVQDAGAVGLDLEALSRHCPLPVRRIEQDVALERDQVYIVPPGYSAELSADCLRVIRPAAEGERRRAIDDFFRSLARERRERAIGLVLSGVGTHGTAGARAIRAEGGALLAQDPQTTEFSGMACSVIEAGCADCALPPDALAGALRGLVAQLTAMHLKGAAAESATPAEIEPDQLKTIVSVLSERTRRDLRGYKPGVVLRRVSRRMGLIGIGDLSAYITRLKRDAVEAAELAESLLVSFTAFFRDPQAWEALREAVIRPLVAQRGPRDAIRVWAPACASGEEAYSLAMTLMEEAARANKPIDFKLYATDLSERSLALARAAVYPLGIEAEVSAQRLERFFQREPHRYRLKREVRERIVFSHHDLLKDPPLPSLDLISCRNVLIYLEPQAQRRVLRLLHYALRGDGHLFLGNAESPGTAQELFEPMSRSWRIYHRADKVRRSWLRLTDIPARATQVARLAERLPVRLPQPSATHLIQTALLAEFGPATAVIDLNRCVVYFHGDATSFLTHPSGEPTRDLLEMVRQPLRRVVHALVREAAAERRSACALETLETGSGEHTVKVTAAPLRSPAAAEYLRVSFEWAPPEASGEPASASAAKEARPEALSTDQEAMESEIALLRSELQSSLDAFQASIEELESAHEEVTAINEELQSANAELEGSREELQAANAELAMVNTRLQAKLLEIECVTDDLKNLLAGTHIAVLFLDGQLRVRRFTPAVNDLLELIPGDLGRPVAHLAQKFTDERLLDDARAALAHAAALEAEVLSHSGRWYLRRTLPYLADDGRIAGIVITFIDISALKRAELELESANARLQEALKSSEALREEAERANRSKDEFIATVSHELRTPLNTIRLWSRMLAEGKLSAGDAAQGARILERSALAQQQLIDDLLDLSRMSRGQLRLELRDTRLIEAVEAALTQVTPLAQARQIQLGADLASGVDPVRADADRIQQVAWNLLTNAVKFTPSGGRVDVWLHRVDDCMELEVRDTGIGIDPEFLPFVFDRFRQGTSGAARRHGGLGLGLSIAKQLVELHGGTIAAESRGPGQGSSFRVSLPLGNLVSDVAEVADRARKPGLPDLSKIEVLLVDDEPSAREALARLLEQYGASVRAVGSSAAAREAVTLHRPDVIVADIGMPGEDGYSLLKALRREEQERHERRIPALAVTAFARLEDRQRALAASFDDHLPKPVDPDRLVAAVATLAHLRQPANDR